MTIMLMILRPNRELEALEVKVYSKVRKMRILGHLKIYKDGAERTKELKVKVAGLMLKSHPKIQSGLQIGLDEIINKKTS